MASIDTYLEEHPEVILSLVGLVFGSIGGYFLWTTLSFWQRAQRVPGTVTGLSGKYGNELTPILQFTTDEGHDMETTASVGARPMPVRPGDEVTVLYDPEDPTTAEMTIWYRLSFAVVFLGIGLVVIGLSALFILGIGIDVRFIIPGVLAGLSLPFTLLGATTLWTALQVRRIGYSLFGGIFLGIGLLLLGSSGFLVLVIAG